MLISTKLSYGQLSWLVFKTIFRPPLSKSLIMPKNDYLSWHGIDASSTFNILLLQYIVEHYYHTHTTE